MCVVFSLYSVHLYKFTIILVIYTTKLTNIVSKIYLYYLNNNISNL